MSKKVRIAVKPHSRKHAGAADAWVEQRAPGAERHEPMKRLTIDLPLSVHTQFKVWCAQHGRNMADELRAFIEQHVEGSS